MKLVLYPSGFKFIAAVILLLTLTSASFAEITISKAEQDFMNKQPNAYVITPGVYSVISKESEKIYAFGTEGMAYTISKLDDLVFNYGRAMTKNQLNEIESAKAQLETVYYSRLGSNAFSESGKSADEATNSGSICFGAIDYDLTAFAARSGFWYANASATGGFLQSGVGPPIPSDALVYTFARATDTVRPLTNLQSDLAVLNPNGLQYVSADQSSASIGPSSQCMEVEAMAYIYISACPEDFESVSKIANVNC